jgi:23S rRNA (guanosine2251-2'-O)-methyltransferase
MLVKRGEHVNARGHTSGERWIYGINAVARRLAVQPSSIREVRFAPAAGDRRRLIAAAAAAAGIPVREAEGALLTRWTGSDGHQGVAALAAPFAYTDLSAVCEADAGPILLLDQIQDPHNLGAVVRTAAAVGMAAVVLPRHGAAAVTPAVEKVAAGAVNDVPICRVGNLHQTLRALRRVGYWSVGLSPGGGRRLFEVEWPPRVALVLGGETGLRPLIEASCDLLVTIPQRPGIESLNASVAAGVAMYEIARKLARLDSP